MNPQLNYLVRSYLRWCPITDGKRLLLNLTKDLITPEDPIAVFEEQVRVPIKSQFSEP